jgi:hypothetical protein
VTRRDSDRQIPFRPGAKARSGVRAALVILAVTVLGLGSCVSYKPSTIAVPGSVWKGEGLDIRVDSVICCVRYKGKFVEALLSIRNNRDHPLRVSAQHVTLVDAHGATTSAAAAQIELFRPQGGWLFKPEEITEFERRWKTRLASDTVVEGASMVQVRVFFPEKVDFERLSLIRVESSTGSSVDIPLRANPQ